MQTAIPPSRISLRFGKTSVGSPLAIQYLGGRQRRGSRGNHRGGGSGEIRRRTDGTAVRDCRVSAARGGAPFLRPTIGRARTRTAGGVSRAVPQGARRPAGRVSVPSEARAPSGIPDYQARAERRVKRSRPRSRRYLRLGGGKRCRG